MKVARRDACIDTRFHPSFKEEILNTHLSDNAASGQDWCHSESVFHLPAPELFHLPVPLCTALKDVLFSSTFYKENHSTQNALFQDCATKNVREPVPGICFKLLTTSLLMTVVLLYPQAAIPYTLLPSSEVSRHTAATGTVRSSGSSYTHYSAQEYTVRSFL